MESPDRLFRFSYPTLLVDSNRQSLVNEIFRVQNVYFFTKYLQKSDEIQTAAKESL